MAQTQGRLDWRAIGRGLLTPLAYWTGAVALLSLFGFPGVVCLTGAAWGLALIAARNVVRLSRTEDARGRLGEATVAGALVGIYLGALFALITGLLFELQPGEESRALVADLLVFFGGTAVCAGLARFYATLMQEKIRPQEPGAS